MTTTNKDFKVKHGLSVADGATFGQAIEIGEPTADDHAATKGYADTAAANAVEAASDTSPTIDTIVLRDDDGEGSSLIRSDIFLATDGVSIRGKRIGTSSPGLIIGDDATEIYTNGTFKGSLNVNSGTITNLSEPTADDHAATKGYVDSLVGTPQGDYPKIFAVTVATTGPINISTDTAVSDIIDGVTLLADNTILVKNQDPPSQNGIYIVNVSGPATRLEFYDNASKINAGDIFYVEDGTQNEDSSYILSNIVTTLGTDPLLIIPAFGPNFITVSNGLAIEDSPTGKNISIASTLESLEVDNFTVNEGSVFLGQVTVRTPEISTEPATKGYVDELINQESVEITTIDDLSNYFNGYNSRFLPTYQGFPVTLQNPFNLLLTIDGIIQSVGSPDYVWQSVMPRVGFRIDNDGYIAFPEAIPVGSSFDARVLVGSETTTQTKVYPFKAMDIVLGGY